MSNFEQFLTVSSTVPTTLVNKDSSGSLGQGAITYMWAGNTYSGAHSQSTGTLTAGVYSTLVNVSGAGVLQFVGIYSRDSTPRQLSLRITLDGVVVQTVQSNTLASNYYGICPIGMFYSSPGSSGSSHLSYDHILFSNSLKIEVASTLSETDKSTLLTKYQLG